MTRVATSTTTTRAARRGAIWVWRGRPGAQRRPAHPLTPLIAPQRSGQLIRGAPDEVRLRAACAWGGAVGARHAACCTMRPRSGLAPARPPAPRAPTPPEKEEEGGQRRPGGRPLRAREGAGRGAGQRRRAVDERVWRRQLGAHRRRRARAGATRAAAPGLSLLLQLQLHALDRSIAGMLQQAAVAECAGKSLSTAPMPLLRSS